MTIIKRKVTRNFTVVANDCFNDKRLGGEQLGALVYLLSRPNDWSVRPPAFARRMRWGRDKSYGVLNSLVDNGYIERRQERDRKTGSFKAVEYIVYDEPTGSPLPENPEAGAQPNPASPVPAKPKAAKKISIESKKISPLSPQPTTGVGAPQDRLSDEGMRPSSRAAQSTTSPPPWKEQGLYEAQLAARLGEEGLDILSKMTGWQLTTLCRRQSEGRVDDIEIAQLRSRYRSGNV